MRPRIDPAGAPEVWSKPDRSDVNPETIRYNLRCKPEGPKITHDNSVGRDGFWIPLDIQSSAPDPACWRSSAQSAASNRQQTCRGFPRSPRPARLSGFLDPLLASNLLLLKSMLRNCAEGCVGESPGPSCFSCVAGWRKRIFRPLLLSGLITRPGLGYWIVSWGPLRADSCRVRAFCRVPSCPASGFRTGAACRRVDIPAQEGDWANMDERKSTVIVARIGESDYPVQRGPRRPSRHRSLNWCAVRLNTTWGYRPVCIRQCCESRE